MQSKPEHAEPIPRASVRLLLLDRVDVFDIDTTGFTSMERSSITGHHWWTLDELNTTSDRLVPGDLASLLTDLLVAGPPQEPITLTA